VNRLSGDNMVGEMIVWTWRMCDSRVAQIYADRRIGRKKSMRRENRDVETAKRRDISEEKSSMRPRYSGVEKNDTA
jgi:hypothetical protein